jgi:hypothetical protein
VKSYCNNSVSQESSVFTFTTLATLKSNFPTEIFTLEKNTIQFIPSEKIEFKSINLFPNPVYAGQSISILGFEENIQFNLYSIDGKLIISKEIEESHVLVEIPNWISPSVYTVKVITQSGKIFSNKLIVK